MLGVRRNEVWQSFCRTVFLTISTLWMRKLRLSSLPLVIVSKWPRWHYPSNEIRCTSVDRILPAGRKDVRVLVPRGVSGRQQVLGGHTGHPNSFLIRGESAVSRGQRWSPEFARVCQFNRLNYIQIFPVCAPICSFTTLLFSFFLKRHLCVPLH